jgi:hypothetical protein
MNAREIGADMNEALGADCIGYSTVTKSLREKSFSKSMLGMDLKPKTDEANFIDEAILGAFEECPFPHSARLPQEYSFNECGSISFGQFFGVSN